MSTPEHAIESDLAGTDHANLDSEHQPAIDEQVPLVQDFMARFVGPLACAAGIVLVLSFLMA